MTQKPPGAPSNNANNVNNANNAKNASPDHRAQVEAALAQQLPMQFRIAELSPEVTRVRTPFTFPDGTIIDLYVERFLNRYNLTDLGETLDWLSIHSPEDELTPAQQEKLLSIEKSCLQVRFRDGQLKAENIAPKDLTGAVFRLAQAAIEVAALGQLD